MDPREFPTKGNLMLATDKKRNVLLKELMALIDES